MNRRRLAIYLNDHMAGSTAGVELARRVVGSNRQLTGYSQLSRLEELGILELGVTGKQMLWHALAQADIPMSELEPLIERARSQRARLEALRRQAAVQAFEPAANNT
ncbi:MAG TPA: hypothetical protein VMF57_17790 [Solirubrobacteraceae bacterium]|nr:hypothetical protein [Solirubrobacteraceae bacterium]